MSIFLSGINVLLAFPPGISCTKDAHWFVLFCWEHPVFFLVDYAIVAPFVLNSSIWNKRPAAARKQRLRVDRWLDISDAMHSSLAIFALDIYH